MWSSTATERGWNGVENEWERGRGREGEREGKKNIGRGFGEEEEEEGNTQVFLQQQKSVSK